MTDVLFLLGRLMIALLLVGSGLGHFAATNGLTRYADSMGVPAARPLVLASGAVMAVSGLAVALGVWIDVALLVACVTVLTIGFAMHAFWRFEGSGRDAEKPQFLKNMAIAGALLALFALVVDLDDVPLTLTETLL